MELRTMIRIDRKINEAVSELIMYLRHHLIIDYITHAF